MNSPLNISIPFSPARRLGLVIFYSVMSAGLVLILCGFMLRERMFLNVFRLLRSGDRNPAEMAALCLILVFFIFTLYMLHEMMRLLFLCSLVRSGHCRIEIRGGLLSYSTPGLDRGWHSGYRSGQAVLSCSGIDSIVAVEVWSRRQLLPERTISIRYKTGKIVSIDALFFSGKLSGIRDRIHDAVFPPEQAVRIAPGALSVIDENGNFIPPV